MTGEGKQALVSRPGSEIAGPYKRLSHVLERMTRDVLARAQSQALSTARFRIGDYELREPDYRQILRWAEVGGMSPEKILKQFTDVFDIWVYVSEPIEFIVEDGAIVSLFWDFERLPFIPDSWESGLLIRELGFKGIWPDASVPLRPVLPQLQALYCNSRDLELLNLSFVPGLSVLNCMENGLTELDLSSVPRLTELNCYSNYLIDLDLSAVPELTLLECGENDLTELDLSLVPGLTELSCFSNKITELDLSPVPRLTSLNCAGNQINKLNLSPVPNLTDLRCEYGNLEELDLSSVPNLAVLYCWGNNRNVLDLCPVPGLTKLYCRKDQMIRNVPVDLKINSHYHLR